MNMDKTKIITELGNKTTLSLKDHRLEEHDIKCVAEILKDKLHVTKLDLSNSSVGCNGLKHLVDNLKDTQIVHLLLRNNDLSIEDLKHLLGALNNTKIRNLDLAKNKIGLKGDFHSFFEALRHTQIAEINLRDNNLGCRGLKYLADVLKDTQISDLNLNNNNLLDEGVKYLGKVLPNTKVKCLYLTRNKISFEAAEYLNGIIKKTTFKNLHLDVHYTIGNRNRHVYQRSCDGFDDVCIGISGDIGMAGSRYINNSFCESGIKELNLTFSKNDMHDVDNFFQAFKGITIGNLHLINFFIVRHLISIFKESRINKITANSLIKACNVNDLAELLKVKKIFDLYISSRRLDDESVRILAPAIRNNNIMKLALRSNKITSEGIKYLSDVLRDSTIIFLNLGNCKIGTAGARHLANGLLHSQITSINLHDNMIEYAGYQALLDVADKTNLSRVSLDKNGLEETMETKKLRNHIILRKTIPTADKIKSAFQKLTSLNSTGDEYEFIVPTKDYYPEVDIHYYVYLIETLKCNPNSKVHIINDMCVKNDHNYDLHLIEKVEDFITNITAKFNLFFNSNLSHSHIFAEVDYINFVKHFEQLKLSDIVQNLLLHRSLFYVDEDQEILHPYIYKLMNQYKLPVYNSELEPNKKDQIILYLESHQNIDAAKEIVSLLKSNCL